MSTPADPDQLGRRSLLTTLAVFVAMIVVVVVGSTLAGLLGRSPDPVEEPIERPRPLEVGEPEPEPEVLVFLGPLATGEPFAGWVIERIDPRRQGALALALRGPDQLAVEVELRPLDARSPLPPASSETLAVYIRSRGRGRETPAGAIAGVLALAEALREREAAGARLAGLEPLVMAN